MGKIKRDCIQCGKEVERYPSQVLSTVYCSRQCRSDYHKKHYTEVFNCHQCGKEKRVRRGNFNYNGNNFCTRTCKDEWQKIGLKGENNPFHNKGHTDETKMMVSRSKKSMNLTGKNAHNYNTHEVKCVQCGKHTFKIGYLLKRSKHHFCSINCHGEWKSENFVGENSPHWKPELTDEDRINRRNIPGYFDFITGVMKRDSFSCDICNYHSKWGDGLNAHHLNSYDWDKTNRTNIVNGITLCKSCHTGFHKTYGYGKNTKEQYYKYKQSKKTKESV